MRAITVFTLFALLISGGIAMANTTDYQLWPASCLKKVGIGEAPPKAIDAEIALFAARGEARAAQLVITPGSVPLKAVRARLDGLSGPNGAWIPSDRIEIDRVGYINMTTIKKIAPDPLPPATPFDVEPGKNQPLWITVSVPRDAKPGAYFGELMIQPEGAPGRRMPVSLTVWNFTLPVGPSSKTAFGCNDGFIVRQHGVDEQSVAGKRLATKYYRFLVDRWISPYALPVPLTSASAAEYVNDPRVTSYVIPYSDNVDEMRASVDSLRKRGLLEKGYFYPTDEPADEKSYARLKEVCEKIRQVDAKLRIVVPYWCDPTFDAGGKTMQELADGLVNIWCPNTNYFSDHPERLNAKLAKGEEFWWYVCCGPVEPYANYFLTMDGPSHRVLPWQQWKYHCQGLLYWSATYWNPDPAFGTADPWVDMATIKFINKDVYGDGSLLYPGKKVGVDGPVSSIRLELLREGLEDYEYLVLLEKKLGRAGAEKYVSRLVTSMTRFSRDPNQWEAVHQAIGRELSE